MEYQYSDRAKNLQGNAIRQIFKVLSDPQMISFAGGLPATDCLNSKRIGEVAKAVVSGSEGVKILQYGETEGYLPFRKTAIDFVKRVGIENIDLSNVIAISGGQQGIDLMCKAFLNKGDCVLVENPTYLAVLHILKTYEAKAYGLKSGDEGIDLADLEEKIKQHKPKFIYLVPNFSNPTGRTLCENKRRDIVSICKKYGVLILEDDPYRELRYTGMPVKAIKAFDDEGICVYVTSFSKTIAPGLRVGIAVGDKELIGKLAFCKQAVDVHTSNLSQAIANEFILSGELDAGIKRAIPTYLAKRDAMLTALDQYMPETFQHTVPEGGLFIWGEFHGGESAKTKFHAALEKKVAYVCGNDFFADGSGDNTLRLNFSNSSLINIDVGIKRLAELFKAK